MPRLCGHGSIPSLAHLCDTRVRGEPSRLADALSPFPVAPSSGTLVVTAALLRVFTLPTQGFRLPSRVTNTRAERPPSQPRERRDRKGRKASTLIPAWEDGQVVCFLAQHSTRRLRVLLSDGPPMSGQRGVRIWVLSSFRTAIETMKILSSRKSAFVFARTLEEIYCPVRCGSDAASVTGS